MERSKYDGKKVKLQFAFVDNSGYNEDTIIVYPFTEKCIASIVNSKITCANYRLGQVKDGNFYVFYAGRVTGETLRQRLLEHVDEYRNYKDAYFNYIEQQTEVNAYRQECDDYHTFLDIDEEEGDEYFRNAIHPARPSDSIVECHICGK